jgi:hypothetical protein
VRAVDRSIGQFVLDCRAQAPRASLSSLSAPVRKVLLLADDEPWQASRVDGQGERLVSFLTSGLTADSSKQGLWWSGLDSHHGL